MSRQLPDLGLLAKLVEYPAVSKGAARFRMQVMAKHSPQNIADAVARLHRAFDEASREQATGEPVQFAAVAYSAGMGEGRRPSIRAARETSDSGAPVEIAASTRAGGERGRPSLPADRFSPMLDPTPPATRQNGLRARP